MKQVEFHTRSSFVFAYPQHEAVTPSADDAYGIVIPAHAQIADVLDLSAYVAQYAHIVIMVQPYAAVHCFYAVHGEQDQNNASSITIILHEHSSFEYLQKITGSGEIQQKISCYLHGDYAQATLRGSYQLTDTGTYTINSLQSHIAAHTKSTLLLKGTVQDAARFSQHGVIEIGEQGVGTESAQTIHTLLLSAAAKATSEPIIEVKTDQVQCGHGSAIGRLNEDQIAYLMARGLCRETAEKLLIDGFLAPVL